MLVISVFASTCQWVILCQIIQYFWMLTPLPLTFCSILIPENFNPQLFTVSKLLRFEKLTEMGVPG